MPAGKSLRPWAPYKAALDVLEELVDATDYLISRWPNEGAGLEDKLKKAREVLARANRK